MDHSIVFTGRLRDGCTAEEVRGNFCRLFRLEPGPRLDSLFSGQPVTLKKGLSEDEARRYADTLLRAGAHCEVVRPRPQPSAVAPAVQAPAAPAPAPAPGALSGLSLLPMEKPAEPEPAAPAPAATATTFATAARPAAGTAAASAAAPGAASPYAVGKASRQGERAFETNNSGGGANTYVPDEVRGLSWGGFLMNWIWGLGNGTYIALLALLPFLGLLVSIYLLFKGRELAWRNRRWGSVDHFNRVQRRWGQAGLLLIVLVAWWGISSVNEARDMARARAAERAAAGPTVPDAGREQELARIEDPAVREQMRQLLEEMERAKAAQSR